ncbi:MAG: transcription elongation factor GreA [Bacteroidales bacterium]|jgi:transcription elongation factor GreA|nr:transcription elongation factor GreA [Bacteroidales bacterium]MBQ5539956.1 transcription elongation factor GreA [Bacteroidales bacterium]MBR4676992.1 transcription elongation factor GreA [Bacteroidales bacterium]MCR4559393.1 transcription elongation factor GreA [Bacteroidales bacterium]
MAKTTYLTEEGLKKLNDELDHLIAIERPNISKQIAEAREKGDLSENAEYDAAKEAQGLLELKISKLQDLIKNARVIDKSQMQSDIVQILSKVTIQNVKNKMKMTYTLVAESEANLKEGKISVETPIAKGLMGKKVGDIAKIKIPAGEAEFKIIDISI